MNAKKEKQKSNIKYRIENNLSFNKQFFKFSSLFTEYF